MRETRTEIFHCEEALWRQSSDGDGDNNVLEIMGGFIRLGSQYDARDYRALREGLTLIPPPPAKAYLIHLRFNSSIPPSFGGVIGI